MNAFFYVGIFMSLSFQYIYDNSALHTVHPSNNIGLKVKILKLAYLDNRVPECCHIWYVSVGRESSQTYDGVTH